MPDFKRTTTLLAALLAALLAFAAVSCDSDPPVGPVSTAIDVKTTNDPGTAAEGNAVAAAGHIVNGHGAVWVGDPWNEFINISFHAKLDADGIATGSWHHQFRSRFGGRIVVQVTCMSVAGNQAWLAGYSTQAGNPANVGRWFGLHVIDNGEGGGAVDEMSRTLWFGTDEQRAIDHCALMPTDHLVTALAAGNVQVR